MKIIQKSINFKESLQNINALNPNLTTVVENIETCQRKSHKHRSLKVETNHISQQYRNCDSKNRGPTDYSKFFENFILLIFFKPKFQCVS